MFDRLAVLEANLERQIGFVRASESRIKFLLTSLSISTTVWLTGFLVVTPTNLIALVCGFAALVGNAISGYHVWSTLFPKVTNSKDSLLFFGGIITRPFEKFQRQICEMDEETYLEDICWQIYRNSQVAAEKFRHIELAMMFWIVSLIPLLLFVGLLISGIRHSS